MFTKVLIANRGEVALRINTTLEKLGIAAVGVYTDQDRSSLHTAKILESYRLEDLGLSGYLDGSQIISAAQASGAQAIHPGYGFLSESAAFANACQAAGLTFIGPPASAMAAMGEKISARNHAIAAGVPVVPGVGQVQMSDAQLLEACATMPFPLLVKPSAGGGGKGLHVVRNISELREVLPIARREAKSAFGDENLLVEKFVDRARHIEFQVIADRYGAITHLGERECSLQRRHQKVIEEAPAPRLSEKTRSEMALAALSLCSAIGYQNVGTVEFLVDADSPESFHFMEMNTRLQVEHRVTELVTGLDLVECQLRIAAQEKLADVIGNLRFKGHAIEARIYAENAYQGFLPTGGTVGRFEAVRTANTVTDTALHDGVFVSSSYDPMLAKIATWGVDRPAALQQMSQALSETVLLGVTTNLDFLIQLLRLPDIQESNYGTTFLESQEIKSRKPPVEVLAAFAEIVRPTYPVSAWRADGWRLGGAPHATISAYIGSERFDVSTSARSGLLVDSYRAGGETWLHHPSFGTWQFREASDLQHAKSGSSGEIASPMPGAVILLHVDVGDQVQVGDPLVVIEAMKMEHVVRARRAGHIARCFVAIGTSVRVGQLLLEVVEDV